MRNVIKRKGERERFDPDKIRGAIQKATIDAGYDVKEKEELIDEIYDKIDQKFKNEGEIKSENIRMCLLTELDECEPYIAKSWRDFDKKYKSY